MSSHHCCLTQCSLVGLAGMESGEKPGFEPGSLLWEKGIPGIILSAPPNANPRFFLKSVCVGGFVSIYLKGNVTERKREKRRNRSSTLLVYSSNGLNSLGWAKPKPEARNSIWVLPHRWQGPSKGHIFWLLPRCIDREPDQKWSSSNRNHYFDMGC